MEWSSKKITEKDNINGLENIPGTEYFVQSPSGKEIPVFQYDISALQSSQVAYLRRLEAFRYDPMLLMKLINLTGQYDILFVGLPTNEEDALIEWKKTYRDQFTCPKDTFIIILDAWVDGS